MADLLFEIGTEDLPDWYVSQSHRALARLVDERLAAAHVAHGSISSFATPRRIAVLVRDVAERAATRTEERRGPAADIAFDERGQPTKAAKGFAASHGVDPDRLSVEDTDRGRYVFVRKEVGGEPAEEILPDILARTVADLPAPRKMRWADVATPFVRPVAWLLAMLGDRPLQVEAAGVASGRVTYGHRFLAPHAVPIEDPRAYDAALADAWVIADPVRRREATLEAARGVARSEGLVLVEDPELLEEVTNLVESPFGVIGRFQDTYLELPDAVLTTVMIHHQRFFPTRTTDGKLAPWFVSVSNNKVPDVDLVRRGYEKVLAGRLHDARFFWDADRTKSLSQHAWGLSGIGFHKELGTMADKVARVGVAARAMADLLGLTDEERETLETALPIFRSDLATDMVFELPELEGTMARVYALEEGMPEAVADALEGGVQPQGPQHPLPATTVGALLAVADRLDKLVGFFAIGRRPSGSADPFGLRRDAVAVARVLNARGWSVDTSALVARAAEAYADEKLDIPAEAVTGVDDFLWDRISGLLAEEGISVPMVRAATADRPAVVVAARRAHLLRALSEHPEFPELMTLYKRAANLAREAPEDAEVAPERFADPHERPLWEALGPAAAGVERLLAATRRGLTPWDLGRGPAGSLPSLDEEIGEVLRVKEPLDAFLDNVLVMVDDDAVRRNRLALLRDVRDTLRGLGDLEELEGLPGEER